MTSDSQTLALLLHRQYPYGPCVFGVTQTKHEAKKAGYVEAEHVRDLGRSVLTDHRYCISSSSSSSFIIEEKLLPVLEEVSLEADFCWNTVEECGPSQR